jgi:hypothetical protein
MASLEPPIRNIAPPQAKQFSPRGLVWGIVAAVVIPMAGLFLCCGMFYWTERMWGTYQFQSGLRITGPARRAYREAAAARPGHFLRVTDSGTNYYATFTNHKGTKATRTITELGITVIVDECICTRPEWQYLKPTITQRGPEKTKGYYFGFAGARPPNGLPADGWP